MIPSLAVLRDLPLRASLPPELEARVRAFAAAANGPEAGRPSPAEGIELVEACALALDAESTRLTEQRFSLGDPMSLRQKQIAEPRRQADQLVGNLKQRLSGERGEWSRRAARQAADFQESLAKPTQVVEVSVTSDGGIEQRVQLSESWRVDFHGWWAASLETWAQHVVSLVEQKTATAIEGDLKALSGQLGRALEVPRTPLPTAGSILGPPLDLTSLEARFEVPGTMEVVFESFKGGLYAVAMISGMIIVPAATVLMNGQSPLLRAGVAAAAVIPAGVFAVRNGQKVRRQLIAAATEKNRDKLKRDLEALLKQRVERFKADAERFAHAYLAQRQQDVLGVIEPAIAATFDERERGLSSQLARTQLEGERIADLLGQLRQVKGGLTTQVLVDLRRLAAEQAARAK